MTSTSFFLFLELLLTLSLTVECLRNSRTEFACVQTQTWDPGRASERRRGRTHSPAHSTAGGHVTAHKTKKLQCLHSVPFFRGGLRPRTPLPVSAQVASPHHLLQRPVLRRLHCCKRGRGPTSSTAGPVRVGVAPVWAGVAPVRLGVAPRPPEVPTAGPDEAGFLSLVQLRRSGSGQELGSGAIFRRRRAVQD